MDQLPFGVMSHIIPVSLPPYGEGILWSNGESSPRKSYTLNSRVGVLQL